MLLRTLSHPWWLVVSQVMLTLSLGMIVLGGIMSSDGLDGWNLLGLAAGSLAFVLNLISIRWSRRNQERDDD